MMRERGGKEMTMKTYYCVCTTVYNSGRVVATIVDTKEAETKPESHCTEKRDRDIYQDWFDTIEEAEKFVKEAKEA